MPVCSYIVYPMSGQESELEKRLRSLEYVDLHADREKKVFILVSDTPDRKKEKELQESLAVMPEIQCTALSFIGNPER